MEVKKKFYVFFAMLVSKYHNKTSLLAALIHNRQFYTRIKGHVEMFLSHYLH